MSRAFVKEAEDDAGDELPDRAISPHPNFVTAAGLAQIEAEVERLGRDLAAAPVDDRAIRNRIGRDLRYWRARRATAEAIDPPKDAGTVHFGSTVTIEREDGRRQTYRIVGEDEADPANGTLSYASPLAQALTGKRVGDVVRAGSGEAGIVSLS